MTFRVSDLGITRLNQTTGEKSTVGYVSYNERMNKNPVRKVDAVSSATSRERSVVREAEEKFASATTPAYNVSFTSQGMTALKSFKTIRESWKNLEQVKDTTVRSSQEEKLNNIGTADRQRTEQTNDRFNRADIYRGTEDKTNDRERIIGSTKRETSVREKTGNVNKSVVHQSYKQAQAVKAYENQMSFASRKQTQTMFA